MVSSVIVGHEYWTKRGGGDRGRHLLSTPRRGNTTHSPTNTTSPLPPHLSTTPGGGGGGTPQAYIAVCGPNANRPSPLVLGPGEGAGHGMNTLYNSTYHPLPSSLPVGGGGGCQGVCSNRQPANSYTSAALLSSGSGGTLAARTSLSSPSRSPRESFFASLKYHLDI